MGANEAGRHRNLPLHLRRRRWKLTGQAGTVLFLAVAALCACVPLAAAASSDAVATSTYLRAQYKLNRALLPDDYKELGPESDEAAHIARECPGVVSGMPGEPSFSSLSTATPRTKGENARLSQQRQTIEQEFGAAVSSATESLYRPAEEEFAAEVTDLAWSDPAIGSALQAVSRARLEAVSTPAPPFCADARAWAQSGYRILSSSSREFQASRAAQRSAGEAELSLRSLLKPYENASDRALIRKTKALENKSFARGLAAVQMILRLEPRLGFPRVSPEEPKQVTVGHGRTAAGTRFEVSSGSGLLGGRGCRRAATVAYGRPSDPETLIVSGPNNPICLSSPQYRRPATFCEAGLETVQTAVPASVRWVALGLADGHDVVSRVVRVPRRDGGPAGIYAQQIGGKRSHAVSLVELDAGRSVVLTVPLPRYRCVKPRNEPEVFPTITQLANGRTPAGEAFTISTLGSINGEPFLSVDAGVDPELNEPARRLGATKGFAWSLKLGCAPHPYAILYGFLMPPGESVVAQTPEGAVTLSAVSVARRVHAKGPLVYGVLSVLPSHLTVLDANGSTVYVENLQAKVTEAAQFCEGYAEP